MAPAPGWIRVSAEVAGVPAGLRCELVVRTSDGALTPIGGWLSAPAATVVAGSAIIDPDRVTAIEVWTDTGQRLVSVPV